MAQEVTTTSWGKRIINSFLGVIIGIALIIGAFYLIFWNEGNGLHTAQSLEQTEKVLISIPNKPVDPKNNNQVIYLSGLATTEDILKDTLFNVSEKAIQLNRKVEMYQWKEDVETKTEKQVGGSEQEVKTYNYHKEWSTDLILSNKFKDQAGHENPVSMPINSKVQYAAKVMVGDFNLPSDLIKQISGEKTVDLSKANNGALQKHFNKAAHIQNDSIYIGDNEQTPNVGDLRISETAVYPQDVSVIAQQSNDKLQAYMAPAGQPVILLEMGQVSPEEMIHNAKFQNTMMMWILRLIALAMLIIGFALIMNPIAVLADVIPFIGSLIEIGTGLIAFTAGLCLWLIAIAIAWFAVRPLMSVAIIAVAVICVFLVFAYRKKSSIQK